MDGDPHPGTDDEDHDGHYSDALSDVAPENEVYTDAVSTLGRNAVLPSEDVIKCQENKLPKGLNHCSIQRRSLRKSPGNVTAKRALWEAENNNRNKDELVTPSFNDTRKSEPAKSDFDGRSPSRGLISNNGNNGVNNDKPLREPPPQVAPRRKKGNFGAKGLSVFRSPETENVENHIPICLGNETVSSEIKVISTAEEGCNDGDVSAENLAGISHDGDDNMDSNDTVVRTPESSGPLDTSGESPEGDVFQRRAPKRLTFRRSNKARRASYPDGTKHALENNETQPTPGSNESGNSPINHKKSEAFRRGSTASSSPNSKATGSENVTPHPIKPLQPFYYVLESLNNDKSLEITDHEPDKTSTSPLQTTLGSLQTTLDSLQTTIGSPSYQEVDDDNASSPRNGNDASSSSFDSVAERTYDELDGTKDSSLDSVAERTYDDIDGTNRTFADESKEGIYESIMSVEHDDSDISWSDSEFESVSEDENADEGLGNGVADGVGAGEGPLTDTGSIEVVDPSEVSDLPADDAAQPSSLMRRIRDSFRVYRPMSHILSEDSLCVPVRLNRHKHPPPELPPLPPEELSKNQAKRRCVVGEIIDSEKSYISSLQRILEEYKGALLDVPLLLKGKVKVLLSKVQEIVQYHQMFQIELAEQAKQWHEMESLGDVFTAAFSKSMVLDAYSDYVNNFAQAMEEIKKATRQRTTLQDFLRVKQSRSADKLSLFGLMIKPIQRFPQFIMFLQDMLKSTPAQHHDRMKLQRALTELEGIAHKLNERKRDSEQKLAAKQIQLNFKDSLMVKTSHEANRSLIRQDDFYQVVDTAGSVRYKQRRLIMMNDVIICVNVIQRDKEKDAESERYKLKWCIPIRDVELREASITTNIQTSVHKEGGAYNITYVKPENEEEDPHHLYTDLSELLHDYTILGQITGLMNSLKRDYESLSEEAIHSTMRDLQRCIQVKDEQVQLVNSCSIVLVMPNRLGSMKCVFQTPSPVIKQEWCLDLQMGKLALDPKNSPSWDISQADCLRMPALFVKTLQIDTATRHFTQVVCAVPVYLYSPNSLGVGIQHLWVCSCSEARGQVSIVSFHHSKPRVTESFQASEARICCVEMVPRVTSLGTTGGDTVWMGTENNSILIFPLYNSPDAPNREPMMTFTTKSAPCNIKYTSGKVFVGLSSGILAIYYRKHGNEWNFSKPRSLVLASSPVTCLLEFDDSLLLCGCGNKIFCVDIQTCIIEKVLESTTLNGEIQAIARAGVGLWVAFKHQPHIHLYHFETMLHLQDVNIASAVQKSISGPLTIEFDYGSSSVTCMIAMKGLLWIGTQCGVILTLPLPRLREGVPQITARPDVAYHSHCGPVQFILPVFCLVTLEPSANKNRTIVGEDKKDVDGNLSCSAENTAHVTDTYPVNERAIDVDGIVRPKKGTRHKSLSDLGQSIKSWVNPEFINFDSHSVKRKSKSVGSELHAVVEHDEGQIEQERFVELTKDESDFDDRSGSVSSGELAGLVVPGEVQGHGLCEGQRSSVSSVDLRGFVGTGGDRTSYSSERSSILDRSVSMREPTRDFDLSSCDSYKNVKYLDSSGPKTRTTRPESLPVLDLGLQGSVSSLSGDGFTNKEEMHQTSENVANDSGTSWDDVVKELKTDYHERQCDPSEMNDGLDSELPPLVNFRDKSKRWQSTPNLADLDGTEDVRQLYGSLMCGLNTLGVYGYGSKRLSRDSDYLSMVLTEADFKEYGSMKLRNPLSQRSFTLPSKADGAFGLFKSRTKLPFLNTGSKPKEETIEPESPVPQEDAEHYRNVEKTHAGSVMIVSGGDGSRLISSPEVGSSRYDEEASLNIWLYKIIK